MPKLEPELASLLKSSGSKDIDEQSRMVQRLAAFQLALLNGTLIDLQSLESGKFSTADVIKMATLATDVGGRPLCA